MSSRGRSARRSPTRARARALAALGWAAALAVSTNVSAAAAGDRGGSGASDVRSAPSSFEFLYAEPNSGAASGGHVALAIGEHVYHFQQVEGGILRLFRIDAARFDHSYRALGNRTLTATNVPVGAAAAEELRWAFETYRQRQDADFDVLDELRRDRSLLERLGQGQGARAAALEASGYFAAEPTAGPADQAESVHAGLAAVRRVAERIEAEHGAEYLAGRSHELALAIESTAAQALGAGFARRHAALASEWLAIEVLRHPMPLAPASWVSLDAQDWLLGDDERARLREIADAVTEAAVALARSERGDRGFPLLVALARLEALERSIASGRLVLLDPARGDEPVVPAAEVRARRDALRRVAVERGEDFRLARAALLAPGSWDESRLSRLELAGAAWAGLAAALEHGAPLRVPTPLQVPSRIATPAALPTPMLAAPLYAAAGVRAAAAEEAWLASLRERYPYDLITRNCVTELFTVLASVPLETHVDPAGALRFVPLAASRAVESTYPLTQVETRPSYRSLALGALARCDGSPLAAGLRESSTITARSYDPNDADPLFLFFTDEVAPLRPVLGALNLAVGAGGVVAGAALAPWDGGTLARRGWEGVIFSVPELAFVSLRRGTIPFAPLGWESDLAALCAAEHGS